MNSTTEHITPSELSSLLAGGFCQLIDVREPVEYAEGHVAGARLISLGNLEARVSEIDGAKPVIVMCHAGKRGLNALEKLRALGFTNVRNLEGGMLAWKAASLPSECSRRGGIPLMRQVQIVIGVSVLAGSVLAVWVDAKWVYLPMFFGAGLIFAGLSGFCGLALILAKMPWNRVPPSQCPPASKSCCAN